MPEKDLEVLYELLKHRVPIVDPDEAETLERVYRQRLDQWRLYGSLHWERPSDDAEPGLMYAAGSFLPEAQQERSWAVPMSMRNVDAECRLEIMTPTAAAGLRTE